MPNLVEADLGVLPYEVHLEDGSERRFESLEAYCVERRLRLRVQGYEHEDESESEEEDEEEEEDSEEEEEESEEEDESEEEESEEEEEEDKSEKRRKKSLRKRRSPRKSRCRPPLPSQRKTTMTTTRSERGGRVLGWTRKSQRVLLSFSTPGQRAQRLPPSWALLSSSRSRCSTEKR